MRFAILLLSCLVFGHNALADDWLYLTYPGDTPLQIGRTYLKNPADWKKILELNHVRNQYVLPSNTRIRIPVDLLKVTPAPVLVTHVVGNVRVKPDNGAFRRLAQGDKLAGGETVLTGPKSFAGFKLADGSTLSEQPLSKLRFGRLAAYGKTGMVSTELDLAGGRLEAAASKQIAPAGGFKVVTPIAVAGLRGTAFRLDVSEDGNTLRNEVLQGVVGISAQNQEVLVAKAEGTVTEKGQPPQPPRPLLPAPSLAGLPDKLVNLELHFAWPATAGARAWRAQVASDARFTQIVLDGRSDTPEIDWQTELSDGSYFLRVRAIDSVGLEGLDADHPFLLDARPLPPDLLTPTAGSRSYQDEVKLVWSATQGADGYLLQLAPTPDFPSADTLAKHLGSLVQTSVRLHPGHWFWRMASVDRDGAHGWSPVRTFRIQPLPSAPSGKATASADTGQAHFAWEAVKGAETYDFELARSRDFASPELQRKVAGDKVAVAVEPGQHYWRVRGVETDGQSGAWSQANPLTMPPQPPTDIRVGLSGGVLHISWQGNAPAYRLEFARNPEFNPVLVRHRQVGNAVPLPAPRPGHYWLRIIALGQGDSPGGQSQPVAFSVSAW